MEPRPHPLSARWELPVALVAVAAAGVAVFRSALGYFFAQDDFGGLARAAGLLPRLAGPWRFVSGQLYFDAMRALAGLHPVAYHAASLAAHAACAVLLVLVLRARVSVAAALVGAALFATHPSLYTAIYSVSGIGEILALLFALAALLAARARGPARWLAVPLFALSLLSKESLLLLPVVVALDRGPRGDGVAVPARGGLLAALALVAVGYLAVFLTHDVFGVWKALPASAPYALAFDSTIPANLLSYAGWAANFTVAGVRSFSDAVDPDVTAWGSGLLAVLVAGLFVPALRERGWAFGVAAFAAFLLPVLPLAHHTYHYYLYAPLAGLAACVAAAADLALAAISSPAPSAAPPRGGRGKTAAPPPAPRAVAPAPAMGAALVLVAILAWNGGALVHKVETMPFALPILRADPTVDRARIARHVRDDLARAGLVPGESLIFWSPSSIAFERMRGGDVTGETYWERNVRAALFDGVGVRVLFPQLGTVAFAHDFEPGALGARWALYAPNGRVEVMTSAEVAAALRAGRVPP